MVADFFFTKPLQGSLFRKLRATILNIHGCASLSNAAASQECVGETMSYVDTVQGMHKNSSDVADAVHHRITLGRSKQTGMSGQNLSLLSAN